MDGRQNSWYCVSGIISSSVKSIIPLKIFIGIFKKKQSVNHRQYIDSFIMPTVLSSIIDVIAVSDEAAFWCCTSDSITLY